MSEETKVLERITVLETKFGTWCEAHDKRSNEFMAEIKKQNSLLFNRTYEHMRDLAALPCETHSKEMGWTRKIMVGSIVTFLGSMGTFIGVLFLRGRS